MSNNSTPVHFSFMDAQCSSRENLIRPWDMVLYLRIWRTGIAMLVSILLNHWWCYVSLEKKKLELRFLFLAKMISVFNYTHMTKWMCILYIIAKFHCNKNLWISLDMKILKHKDLCWGSYAFSLMISTVI